MKPTVLASTLLLGGLAGCATPVPPSTSTPTAAVGQPARRTPVPVTVAPAPATTASRSASEMSFLLALRAHGQGQLRLAAEHYAQALAVDERHAGALNGLGVIRAQEGRTDEALALFARSSELHPTAAHVHNNLGYALLQAHRLSEARLALRLAMELDPSSVQTLQNLRLLSDAERRTQADAADAVREQPVVNASGAATAALVVVAPHVYALRASAPAATPVTASVPAPPVASAAAPAAFAAAQPALPVPDRMRLEVSNGAGIERLARRTAGQLAKTGVTVARLTNEMPYRQVRTQIRYVVGQETALQALTQRLPVSVERVAVASLPAGMQLKLVLGRDFSGQAIAAWITRQDAEAVAASTSRPAPRPASVG